VASLYLNALNGEQYEQLKRKLLAAQNGFCFICEQPIDIGIQPVDVDHVEPTSTGGKDDPANFALAHASCNRSKQASDLRVARVLARFARIRDRCIEEGQGPNLSDVLEEYGGAKERLSFRVEDGSVRYSLGDHRIFQSPLLEDELSGLQYFFAKLPITYLHHDDRINPRNIGGAIGKLVEEFHRGRPQLHVSLAWVASDNGQGEVKVFDGQHKATAQVLLGVTEVPVRVFVNPDPDLLLTANTNAGTTLRQVAFDKSVQRRLGSSLFADRLERYRREHHLTEHDSRFSERDLMLYFKGEAREMKRYILDSVRDSITHDPENKLRDYIDFAGKATEKPLSYSTVEKTFYSFFIYPDVLETPLDYMDEEDANPRTLEIRQILRLMNLIADEIFAGQFDASLGTYRIENKLQKGEPLPEPHVRAFRLAKEEILYVWLGYVRQIVQTHFGFAGVPVDEKRLFQQPFPESLWVNLRAYISNLNKMPVWVNRELSNTIFGGKQTYEFWKSIFQTGKTPGGIQVLVEPINFTKMINAETAPAVAVHA
jgi:HNH endonuclease